MPTFSTQYILTNGAIAAGTALANVEYIAGALKTYPNTTHLNFSASNFPDRFTEGQIVYVSASNELFKMGKYFDDQITFADVVTSQSFEFPSSGGGGSTDISALNAFTSSAQTSLTALNAATSSYILASQTSSMNVLSALTASYLIGGAGTIDTSSFVTNDQTSSMSVATASFISDTFISASAARSGFGTATLPSGVLSASAQIAVEISGAFTEVSGGLAGRITTLETTSGGDVTALNLFTSSIQTQVDNLTAETSSYLTSADTASFIVASQTSSMNVLSALTASYLIGGAGTIDTSSFVTNDQTSSFLTSADTASLVRVDQTSSMSVATASYVDPTFISASAAAAGFGTATLPSGVLSSSAQIATEISGAFTEVSGGLAGRITTLEGTSGGDVTALNLFTSSIQTQVDNLTAETSSYALKTDVSGAFSVDSASISVRLTSAESANASGNDRLNVLESSSISLTAATSSYLTAADTASFVLVSQTSSMSVATASYVSPTFISASAAAAGFGSGGGSVPAGTVSSSAQVVQNLVGQDVVVNSITAETYIISSSVSFITTSFSSGSTAFGDSLSDTHTFTGSVSITGSLNIGGPFTVNNENLNVSSGSIILTNSSSIVVLDSGIISGTFVGNLNYDYITNLPNLISSSTQIALLSAGILSASAQIASDISGAFTSLSSSFASRITALEGAGGGSGIFTLTGSFYSTTNNIQITGSLSVGSGSFKSFEVNSDGFVVLGDMDKDLNTAPIGTVVYSGSSFYLIS